jgi:hypothetical protein
MSKLGPSFVSVVKCEVRPLHEKVVPRDKDSNCSTSEIATFGANEKSYTVASADGHI